jgi:hypothetical protein
MHNTAIHSAVVGRNNQRALRRMCDIKTSGAMSYAYCTLRELSLSKHESALQKQNRRG